MPLKKGQTNNPNGRPKGSRNKVTASLRARINDFLNDNWQNLQKDFDKLEPKDRLQFYEKLLQYGLPRLQSTELTGEFQNITLDTIFPPDDELEKMTSKELDLVINKLKKSES